MKTEKDINCQALHWPGDGICQQELQKCIFHTNTLFPGAQRDLPMSIVFWADIFLGHLVDISAGLLAGGGQVARYARLTRADTQQLNWDKEANTATTTTSASLISIQSLVTIFIMFTSMFSTDLMVFNFKSNLLSLPMSLALIYALSRMASFPDTDWKTQQLRAHAHENYIITLLSSIHAFKQNRHWAEISWTFSPSVVNNRKLISHAWSPPRGNIVWNEKAEKNTWTRKNICLHL